MRRPRTLAALALVLLAACLAVGVPSASAIDPFPTTGIATLASDHFMVHYSRNDGDSTCGNYITQERAGDILGMLERARSYYSDPLNYKLGVLYPAPIPDTDGYVHVSIDDFGEGCVPYGAIPGATPIPWGRWDALVAPIGVPGADDIHLNAVANGLTYPVIAHEVFHLVEDAMVPDVDQWLQEGSAEWAATRANADASGTEANPDRTMDCVGSECGDTDYDRNGYPGWMLFEYLAERYGDPMVKTVWDHASSGTPATTTLAGVLPVSLASFFNDYTTARLTGNFTFPVLAGQLPAPYADIEVGATSGTLPGGNVAVNHLAVRYVTFSHGTDTTSPCFAASLTINVDIPAGVTSMPYYYANTKGSSAQALTVSGSTASITVPWNTCGGSPAAYLSLPNDSLGLDGREFTVGGHLDVDLKTPASPSDPPAGVHVIGSVISAPTTDPSPTLKVYAPEVIRVSPKTHLLRFAVFSSGDGKLAATLGSTNLGWASLRGGNNDVRFELPTQLFKSLRTKSTSNLLALTSVSPSGTTGSTVTRRVLVQAPKKPKHR
jgi:hypothetical protein